MCFICVVLFVQLTKTIYTYTTLKGLKTTCFSSLHHPPLPYKLPSTDFCFYHTLSLFSNIAAHCVIFYRLYRKSMCLMRSDLRANLYVPDVVTLVREQEK